MEINVNQNVNIFLFYFIFLIFKFFQIDEIELQWKNISQTQPNLI